MTLLLALLRLCPFRRPRPAGPPTWVIGVNPHTLGVRRVEIVVRARGCHRRAS